jgi:uncharacterized protein YneR
MEHLLTIISSIILISLIGALIFKDSFRKDILISEGEATIFGILNVKGVAIVVLTGLFLGAIIWSTNNTSKKLPDNLSKTVYQNQLSNFNQIKTICNSINREIFNYYNSSYLKGFSKGFSNTIPNDVNYNQEIDNIIQQSSSRFISNYRKSLNIINSIKDKAFQDIIEYYKNINLALQEGNIKEYNKLIETTPTAIIELQNLDDIILKISKRDIKEMDDYLNEVKKFISNK